VRVLLIAVGKETKERERKTTRKNKNGGAGNRDYPYIRSQATDCLVRLFEKGWDIPPWFRTTDQYMSCNIAIVFRIPLNKEKITGRRKMEQRRQLSVDRLEVLEYGYSTWKAKERKLKRTVALVNTFVFLVCDSRLEWGVDPKKNNAKPFSRLKIISP
jgi:hypothetical protein